MKEERQKSIMSQTPRRERISGRKEWLPLSDAVADWQHALLIAWQQLANSCVLSMAVYLPSASSCTSVPSHQSEGQSGILCPGVMYAIQLTVECTDVIPPCAPTNPPPAPV